jgi:Asp/Glu/hydantoin racemase
MKGIMRGFATYGHSIGIIMLDCVFQRIPGDIGNATTFDFPVLYRIVRGVPVEKIVNERDENYLPPFIEAARELEADGVRAITTSCGCLALYHKALVKAVKIPVFTSTLMQVPLVHQMLGGTGKVGILAADLSLLTDDLFQAVGWSMKKIPVVMVSMDSSGEFTKLHSGVSEIDFHKIESDAVAEVRKLIETEPDVRALIIECTNLVPYAAAIQRAIQLPIFDIVTLTNMVHQAAVRRRFTGYL